MYNYQLQCNVSNGSSWWQGVFLAISPSFGGVGEAGTTWGATNPHTHSEFSDGTQSPLLVQAGAPWEPNFFTNSGGFPVFYSPTGTGWNGPNCPIVNNIIDPDSLLPLNERKNYLISLLNSTDTLLTVRDSTFRWTSLLNTYRILESDSALLASDTLLQNFYDSCAVKAIGQITRAFNIVSDTTNLKIEDLFEVADSLNQWTSTWKAQNNLCGILGMKLRYYTSGTLNYSEQAEMRLMADACPYEEGLGVHTARSLVLSIDQYPTWQINDCEMVGPPPSERRGDEDTEIQGKNLQNDGVSLTVQPNPTVGKSFEIIVNGCESNRSSLLIGEVVDVLGHVVATMKFICDSRHTVNLPQLNSGIYILRVRGPNEGGFNENIKVILQ